PFTVLPVSPEQVEIWADLWPHLSEGVTADEQSVVAYKAMKAGAEIKVYYSTVFEPYRAMIDRLKLENPALAPLFETSYAVWVGYHVKANNRQPRAASHRNISSRFPNIDHHGSDLAPKPI